MNPKPLMEIAQRHCPGHQWIIRHGYDGQPSLHTCHGDLRTVQTALLAAFKLGAYGPSGVCLSCGWSAGVGHEFDCKVPHIEAEIMALTEEG